jgi:hypothetical protein
MSLFGSIPAGGPFATLQSAAMGGYGASVVSNAVRAGAAMTSLTVAYRMYRKGARYTKAAR